MTPTLSDLLTQPVTAARFVVMCPGWTAGLGFSKLAGFNTEVETQEYSYNGRIGNVHSKQFGRTRPPQVVLERGLDKIGFTQMFGWHALARMNNPLAKLPASFTILNVSGNPAMSCILENAWCAKLEIDPAEAGASSVLKMRATLVCDSILLG